MLQWLPSLKWKQAIYVYIYGLWTVITNHIVSRNGKKLVLEKTLINAKSSIVAEDGQIQCGIYIQYIVLFPAHVKNARWALYGRKFWPNIIPALCTAYVIGLLNCWCGIYPKTLKCALMPSYYKGRILFLMLNIYLLLLFRIQHYSRIIN